MKEKIKEFGRFLTYGRSGEIEDEKIRGSFQRKVLKAVFWFFLIFFICGLISRGMYGAMLPRVGVESPRKMSLTHRVEAEGNVVENKRAAVLAKEGIRIEAVLVKQGQSVSKDEPLVQLDLNDLESLIEDKEIEIEKIRIQIKAMEKNQMLAAGEKAVNQKRANEDYENTRQKSDINLGKVQDKINEAKAERDRFPSWKEYVAQAREQDGEYQTLLKSIEEKKQQLEEIKSKETASEEEKEEKKKEIEQLKLEIEEARQALAGYKESLTASLKQEWERKKEELEQNVSSWENENRQASLQKEEDMRMAGRAVEDANREAAADSSLELARLEKRELEKQLEAYKKVKEQGGKILAPMEGDIVEIHAIEGERTGDNALLHMTDKEEGYRFRAEITKKDRKYMNIGDLVEVKIGKDEKVLSDIPVETIEESEEQEDMYVVSFPITKDMGRLGDSGAMKLSVEKGEKSLCVPLSAVHSDGMKNYVLLATTNWTILGEELKAVRRDVTILDKNESTAAIDSGAITEEDRIIVSATKHIKEGDTVRLLEN